MTEECWVPRYLHRPVLILWFELPVYVYLVFLYGLMATVNLPLSVGYTVLLYLVLAVLGVQELLTLPRGITGHCLWWCGLGGWRPGLGPCRWPLSMPGGLQGYPAATVQTFTE